jgi:hypothetical protein
MFHAQMKVQTSNIHRQDAKLIALKWLNKLISNKLSMINVQVILLALSFLTPLFGHQTIVTQH